jgi:hypothetical protein
VYTAVGMPDVAATANVVSHDPQQPAPQPIAHTGPNHPPVQVGLVVLDWIWLIWLNAAADLVPVDRDAIQVVSSIAAPVAPHKQGQSDHSMRSRSGWGGNTHGDMKCAHSYYGNPAGHTLTWQ